MDFAGYCFLLAVFHFVVVYFMAIVMKTSYGVMWATSTVSSAIIAAYVRRVNPEWRTRLLALAENGHRPQVFGQLFLGLLFLLAGGLASFAVIYRAYGTGATLFTAGTNLLVSSI